MAHRELRRSLQGKRFDRTHTFTDVIDLHKATVTNGQRGPTVLVSVNLDTEKSRKGTLLGPFAIVLGERPARSSSPTDEAIWPQLRTKQLHSEVYYYVTVVPIH